MASRHPQGKTKRDMWFAGHKKQLVAKLAKYKAFPLREFFNGAENQSLCFGGNGMNIILEQHSRRSGNNISPQR